MGTNPVPETSGWVILIDEPAPNAALGFADYARGLATVIRDSKPQFAVGIFGTWGSGKTTLMRAIQRELKKSPQVVTVQFNAWRYEKEEHLIIPLLDTIREAFDALAASDLGTADIARQTATTIGKVTKALVAGISFKVGLPNAIELSYQANSSLEQASKMSAAERASKVPRSFYHASFRALAEAFDSFVKRAKGRVVVFVDDLDRCLPTGALEVLEAMKLFFDFEGFVFVVGLDRAVVEWCIDSKYERGAIEIHIDRDRATQQTATREGLSNGAEQLAGGPAEKFQIRGSDYINKIFQVPFSLPPIRQPSLGEFIDSLGQALPAPQFAHLKAVVQPHLEYLVPTDSYTINPRQLKQYINGYTIQMLMKPLDPDGVLALQTISARADWRQVRQAIYADRQAFAEAARSQADGQTTALADFDPQYASIPFDFIQYISLGAPGRRLVELSDLADYVYSGEATRSTLSSIVMDLIRSVSQLRPQIHAFNPADPTTTSALQLPLSGVISQVQSYAATQPVFQRVLATLLALQAQTVGTPGSPAPSAGLTLKQADELINRAKDQLMQLYETGAVGSSVPASA